VHRAPCASRAAKAGIDFARRTRVQDKEPMAELARALPARGAVALRFPECWAPRATPRRLHLEAVHAAEPPASPPVSVVNQLIPVTLPPGRLRLDTNPA